MWTINKAVTFYVTRPDGEIPLSGPSIFWPFGSGVTDGHSPVDRQQRPMDAAKNIRFENGFFTTSDPDVIWLLDHYNSGGTYEDEKRGISMQYSGEQYICRISREDPNAPKIKLVEKKETVVEKTVFPREVLEWMDPAQLIAIAGSIQVDLTGVDKTTAAIVKVLEDKGHVKG